MPPPSLTAKETAIITSSNRSRVIQELGKIRARAPTAWLSPNAHYPNGVPPTPWTSLPAGHRASIVELISVSGPNHCIDGWGFLARALSSLAIGDIHSARHFAYYAELRAALSILASNGIGVFNGLNCAIDGAGHLINVHKVNANKNSKGKPTHQIAWLALEAWAKGQNTGAVICNAFSLRTVSFDACLSAMWPGTTTRPGANELILSWGVDLQHALDDRAARNLSSYNPQSLQPLPLSPTETVTFLESFWECFEPQVGDPFIELDRHLLRLTIESQNKLVGGAKAALSTLYKKLDPSIQAIVSEEFITRSGSEAADLPLLAYGRNKSASPMPTEMIARAGLLLRSASAQVMDNFFHAGISGRNHLSFWMLPYGQRLGFWDDAGPSGPMYDLWLDVRDALDDVISLKNSVKAPAQFNQSLWSSRGAEGGFPRISETERIALWSLCA